VIVEDLRTAVDPPEFAERTALTVRELRFLHLDEVPRATRVDDERREVGASRELSASIAMRHRALPGGARAGRSGSSGRHGKRVLLRTR
jgi:hypothetical protein